MDKKKATETLLVLLARTADCKCGNHEISRDEVRAIEFFLKKDEPVQLDLPLSGNELRK